MESRSIICFKAGAATCRSGAKAVEKLLFSRVLADIRRDMLLFVSSEYLAKFWKPSCADLMAARSDIRISISLNMLDNFRTLFVSGIASFRTRFMEPPILLADLLAFFCVLSTPIRDFL